MKSKKEKTKTESPTLAEYVRRIMSENRLSGYDVERRCDGAITQSYVNRIANGAVTNPSPQKLKALAKGLDVPDGEILKVAAGIFVTGNDLVHDRLAEIDAMYARMSGKKKKRADYLIEMLEREVRFIIKK